MAKRTDPPKDPTIDDLFEQLQELEETVDTEEERKEVEDVKTTIDRLPGSSLVGKRIERYTTRDVAESFVGSILISLPLLVEDGVFDIGDHLLAHSVAGVPLWLSFNVAFIVIMTWGLLYWADFRDVTPSKLFGLVPRRLLAVLLISLTTATLTMTLWGRVGGWEDPAVAFARISVIWAAAAFGAALGDILPGESTGTDLRDVPDELGDTFSTDD